MADLVRLAHYPFLPAARDAVRRDGPALDDILANPRFEGVRRRALARVEGAMGEGIPSVLVTDAHAALRELLSVPVARMLAVATGEKILLQRLAGAEARRVHDSLAHDEEPTLEEAAAVLELPVQRDGDGWRIHFAHYLRVAPSEPEWKLIRRPVARGWVPVSREDLARLVQEALARRILEELDAERGKPMADEVRAALAPLLAELEPRLAEARESWTSGDFGPVQPGLFPPCIQELFASLARGENVPHHGRFAFATFLKTVGWNAEQIMDYMSTAPNFDREKSRYQIEHVTGERGVAAYTPPGCATMQTNGICPLDKRDAVCFTIKHPLSYYRKRLRYQENDKRRAAEILAAHSAQLAKPPAGPKP